MAWESWICWDLNVPPFTKSTLTRKNTIAIAIINVDMSRVSIILFIFAAAKVQIKDEIVTNKLKNIFNYE